MTNYTKTTDFAAKDSLPSGDSGKIIRGTEFETEFDNIATAVNSKSDANNPTFTGTVTIDGLTVNGNTVLGNAATDTVTVTADIASNLIPSADDTYNLGAVGAEWNDLFIDGVANIDSLVADTADINGGTVDGVTIGGSSAGAITGTTITGTSFVTSGDMTFGDYDKAVFGAGSDLQIYHSGLHSYITDTGAGNLYLGGSDSIWLGAGDLSETYATFNDNGAVTLRHDNAPKLATTSTGIDVTGTATMDGLTVDGTLGNWSVDTQGAIQDFSASGTNYIRATNAAGSLRFGSGGVNNRLNIANNGDISFYEDTGTTAKFFWDASAERLGIGNSAPTTALDVSGTVTADGLDASTGDITTTSIGFNGSRTTTPDGLSYPIIWRSAGAHPDFNSGDLVIQARSDADRDIHFVTGNTPTERMNIDGQTGDISFYEDTGTTPKFFWDSSTERLGIGTSNPSDELHLARANDPRLRIDATATGVASNLLLVNSADNLYAQIENDGSELVFKTQATERMRINSSGHLIVPNGVTLGTAVGTYAAAKTLDDYEEGTWIPVIQGSSTAGTGTYSAQYGSYTKVGNAVTFTARVAWSAHTGAGNMLVAGLPFNSSSAPDYRASFPVYHSNISMSASHTMQAIHIANVNTIQIREVDVGGGTDAGLSMDSSGVIVITGVYFTA